MSCHHRAVALLAMAMFSACSSDPGAPGFPPSSPGGPAPPPPEPLSYHYVGKGGGAYTGIGELVSNDWRCPGYAFLPGGICLEFMVDGMAAPKQQIARASMIELFIDPDDPGQPAWLDVQHAVIGPVESVDVAHAQLTVLGQTVYVTDLTVVDGHNAGRAISDLEDLAIGGWVRVSGHFSAAGEIVASLVQSQAPPGRLLLRGVLAAGTDGSFRIGRMGIDLSGASLRGFPGGTPLAGDTVLLTTAEPPDDGHLPVQTALYAYREARPFAHEMLTGFVTAVRSSHDFDIAGSGFRTSTCEACDILESMGTPPSIGTFAGAGTLPGHGAYLSLAWTTGDDTGLVGPLEASDPRTGALSIMGFKVQTTPATRIATTPGASLDTEMLDLTELAMGDIVAVNGGTLGGTIVADRLGRAVEGARIRAREYELADPTIAVLGRSVEVSHATDVLYCGYLSDNCTVLDTDWLFRQTLDPPPFLLIDVEIAGARLQATRITAYVAEL